MSEVIYGYKNKCILKFAPNFIRFLDGHIQQNISISTDIFSRFHTIKFFIG